MRDILLVKLNGLRYGIWNDEVASVRESGTVHRFPLSPACIAGISLIDDRTVTIADLSRCIGGLPATKGEKQRLLLLKTVEKPTGFLVDADIVARAVSDDDILPLPDYLRTDSVSACIIQDDVPVPIIDAALLYVRVLKGDQKALQPLLTVSPDREAADAGIQLFRIAEEIYGFLATGTEESSIPFAEARELPFAPPFIRGIILHRNQLVPVIDLAQRIRRGHTDGCGPMIAYRAGGALFALLTDENRGRLDRSDAGIVDLPPLAATPWIRSAALHRGEIIPLVDVDYLLSARDGGADEGAASPEYSLDSGFPEIFNKEAAEVLEFSFFGARHALPKSDVEDVIPFRSGRSIPETRDIVLGVVAHNSALLPVLDLAAVFGRRSCPDTGWSMILVRNGDFRAFVIAEIVYGKRRLEVDVQRDLPLNVPHQMVYGCYPDADAVRLILNVSSLALHFEESLVRELLPVLSAEMERTTAEIISAPFEEKGRAAIAAASDREEASAPADMIARYQEAPAVPMAGSLQVIDPVPRERQRELVQDQTRKATVQKPEPVVEAVPIRKTEEPSTAPPLPAETTSVSAAESGAAGEPAMAVEDASAKAARGFRSEMQAESVQRIEQPEPECAHFAPSAGAEIRSGEVNAGNTVIEQTTAAENPPAAAAAQTQSKALPEPGPGTMPVSEPETTPVPEPAPGVIGQRPDQMPTEAKPAPDAFERPAPAQLSISYPDPEPLFERSGPLSDTPRAESAVWKRRMAYAGIALLFALIILFLPRSGTRKPEIPADKAGPSRVEQARPDSNARKAAEQSEPPLVLEVPRETPIATDVYIVVKGDTLWNISARFTGNPFNYPRIAGENRIANPDLIFPGQRIRLMKKP